MTKKVVISSILIWFLILNLQNIYNFFLDNKVNNYFENWSYYLSYNYYSKKSWETDIFNQANSLYKLNVFSDSLVKYLSLENSQTFKNKYDLFYNIWNNYYRLWEKLSFFDEKLKNYNKALEYYLMAKEIKPTSKVIHNYDFVLNKINELKDKENNKDKSENDNLNSKPNPTPKPKPNNIPNNNQNQEQKAQNNDNTDTNESKENNQNNTQENSWSVNSWWDEVNFENSQNWDWLYLTEDLKQRLLEEQKRLLEEQQKYQWQIFKQDNIKNKTNDIFDSILNDQIFEKSFWDESKDW